MKKISLLITMMAMLLNIATAQTSALTNAVLQMRAGVLDKAMVSIEKAAQHGQTKDKAKTWFIRGEIYLFIVTNEAYANLLKPGEGLPKAFESFTKVLQLEGKDGEFGKVASDGLESLYSLAMLGGTDGYNAGDFDNALNNFTLADRIHPADTSVILNLAYTYEAKQDFANARAMYYKLIGIAEYRQMAVPSAVYSRLLFFARQNHDPAETKKLITAALSAYPGDKQFMSEDLTNPGNK